MKAKEHIATEQFLLIVFFILSESFIILTVITPLLFEAAHQRLVTVEKQAQGRVAANSMAHFVRGDK